MRLIISPSKEILCTQFDLENDQYQAAIIDAITNALPSVGVDSINVADDVDVTIEFTIDADNADNAHNAQNAHNATMQIIKTMQTTCTIQTIWTNIFPH